MTKSLTCAGLAAAALLLAAPHVDADVTLTFREQGVSAELSSTPLTPDRKTKNGGFESDSLTASLEYSNDDIQGTQSAAATITAQPTFDNDFNLTGFFGGGSVTAVSPTGAYRSVAEASFSLSFLVDEPVNFNLNFTPLSPDAYYDLYENIPNFALYLGTGVEYNVNADEPPIRLSGTNGGGNISQVIEPGQVSVDLEFIASALDEEMSTASFDFFFLASISPIDSGSPSWDEPAGGDFNAAENWSADAPPASGDAAFFELPATYTVTLDEDTEVGDLNIHAGDVTLDYGTHKIETGPLSVTGTEGSAANLSVGADVGVIPAEHGLVATSITVGAGGSLRNFSSAQFFVGQGDFPTGDPNSDQANTDLRALEGLRVENGGQLQTPHAKVDGPASADGTGVATATIDGAGSTWRALSLVVGQTQTGRVEVTNGGQLIGVDVGSESLSLEAESPNANSQSLIRVAGVAGPNTPSTLRAADITLGIDHVGRLEAVDGALVAADVLRLAIRPMARGTAVFRGAGTRFEGANGEFGRIKVADGGFGRLDIEDGAVVHADVIIGDISVFALGDNRGFVYLTDTGSHLKSNMLTVGRQSYGEINIANGAQATATLVRLSEVTNGEGVANLSGMGSQLTIGLGGLNIGSSMGDGKGVLNVTNGAVVDVIADGLGSTNVDSAGTINLRSGGKLRTTTLQTIGKITIEGADSHLTSDIGIVGEGSTITIDGGQLTNREEQFELRENDVMTVRNGGRVNTARWIVGAGSHVTLTGNGTLVKLDPALSSAPPADPTLESGEGLVVGTVNISNGARIESERLLVAQGGVVTGDDGVVQLAAGGALVNDGSLEQGTSPGTLTIDGDLVQTDLGQIVFEIAGLTPDELHDQLIVTGDAFIAGKVIFKFLDGFAPSEGDTFDLLNVAGTTDLSGVEFEVANLAPGFGYDISLDHGGMRLVSLNNATFVPEPTTSLLVAIGLLTGTVASRRKRYLA